MDLALSDTLLGIATLWQGLSWIQRGALVLLYLSPTLIALYRQHPSTAGIAALSLPLGFLLLPWGAALVWAMIPDTQSGSRQR